MSNPKNTQLFDFVLTLHRAKLAFSEARSIQIHPLRNTHKNDVPVIAAKFAIDECHAVLRRVAETILAELPKQAESEPPSKGGTMTLDVEKKRNRSLNVCEDEVNEPDNKFTESAAWILLDLNERIKALEQRGEPVDPPKRRMDQDEFNRLVKIAFDEPTPAVISGSSNEMELLKFKLLGTARMLETGAPIPSNHAIALHEAATLLEQLEEDNSKRESWLEENIANLRTFTGNHELTTFWFSPDPNSYKTLSKAIDAAIAARKEKASGDSATSRRHEDASKGDSSADG